MIIWVLWLSALIILLVPIGGDDTYDAVRDSVADLGLPLSRMEQRRHQVEELFRDSGPDGAWTTAPSVGPAPSAGPGTAPEAADVR